LALEEDHEGNIIAVYEKKKMKGRKVLTNKTWAAKLTDAHRNELKNNGEIEIVHSVIKDDSDGKVKWIYRDSWSDGKVILDQKEMKSNPYIPFRFSKISEQPYGRGPGMVMYGDTRTLNKTKEFILKSAAFDMLGVWLMRADGVLNPYATTLKPGEHLIVADTSTNNGSVRRIDTNTGGFQQGQVVSADLRQSINEGFLADRLGRGDRMTTAEIVQRSQIAQQTLGSTFGRLIDEWLLPMVKQFMEILKEQKVFGDDASELEIGNEIIDIVFLGSLAQAQMSTDVQNIIEFNAIQAQFAQFDQAGAYVLDVPQALRKIAENRSISRSVLRTADEARAKAEEDAKALAQARAAEQQQQQQG
jgi:hypothetical protein